MYVVVSVLVVLLASSSLAQIQGELNCTAYNGTSFVYSASAVACSNVLSDQYCQVAYPSANSWLGYPEEGSSFQRPLLCFTTGTTSSSPTSKDAKTAAIAHCPKTCGLCCQTSTYSCQNAPFPRLNCASVTKAMCLSITWRQILAEDCPNFCGFCDLNGCIDLVTGCDSDVSICNAIGMQEFVNLNCRRTCGRCSVATPKPCSGR